MPEGRTHIALRIGFIVQRLPSLLGILDYFWRAILFLFKFIWVLPSPSFGDPAALVKERSNDDDVVPEDVLCHSHPVDLDVWSEALPSPDRVLVDSSIMRDDDGYHHSLGDLLFSRFLCRPNPGTFHLFP